MYRSFRFVLAMFAITPVLLSSGVPAQEAAPERGAMVWIAPEPDNQPIALDSVDIRIDVAGFVARTRMELAFANPNPRIMEGEFVFPLPPGLTISGYELEVDGRLRAGVVVPKQTARVAYEDTIRQQIDPGLAELTQGNVFRTRLYPIPAGGLKRIALSFEQVLPATDGHYRYVLPLSFTSPVRRFTVHAEARSDHDTPVQMEASPDPNLRFDRAGSAWIASFERENVQPQRELAFSIPVAGERPHLLIATDPLDPEWRTVVAEVDTGLPDRPRRTAAPRRIALFYDASGSARDRDRERELAVLAHYLGHLDQVEVDLIAFRDAAEPARRFQIRSGDSQALFAAIRSLPLDGGSSYGAIDLAMAGDSQLALVIGDGLSNFGTDDPAGLDGRGRAPVVYAMHAAQRADSARLNSIARRGGGELLDLLRLDTEEASAALLRRPWQLLSLHAAGADCRDLVPEPPAAVGRRAIVAARCRGLRVDSVVHLRFGHADQPRGQRHVKTAAGRNVDGALADSMHRIWAQARIAAIDSGGESTRETVTALATRYAVVSRYTSLLVLDRIEDYVRYRIQPPEPELRAEYQRLLSAQPKPGIDTGRKQRLARLVDQWQQFRSWHERSHTGLESGIADGEADLAREQAPHPGPATTALAARELQQAPPPPPPAPPAAPAGPSDFSARSAPASPRVEIASAADDGAHALDRIEVTGNRIGVEEDTATEPGTAPGSRIHLSAWDPRTPYLDALRDAADPYATYLEQREIHGDAPGFYLDCADFFRDQAKQPALAVRILSNIAELDVENTALTRILGYRLLQWQLYSLAAGQFEAVLAQRPEEPQSYRDLALVLTRLPEPQTDRALQLLWQVASGEWHDRFSGIELIAMHELNALLASLPDEARPDLKALSIPPELLDPLAIGLRVVLTWDADNTDIDLWVVDPAGEKAYYSHNRTRTGGHVSADFTQGYGPEVYTIARPLPGTYRVLVNYFGDSRQTVTGPVTVQVEFQTRFGSVEGDRHAITRRLESGKETIEIGEFIVGR